MSILRQTKARCYPEARRTKIPAILLVLFFLVFFANVSEAAQIMANFEGIITDVDTPLAGTFSINQTISGSFVYDTSVPFADFGNSRSYYTAIVDINFTVGGQTGSRIGPELITIDNTDTLDSLNVYGRPTNAMPGIAGFEGRFFGITLVDSTGSAFDNLDLPTELSSLEFTLRLWQWNFAIPKPEGGETWYQIRGNLSSLNAPIPEPSTMLLLGSGLLGLAGYGRKKYFKK